MDCRPQEADKDDLEHSLGELVEEEVPEHSILDPVQDDEREDSQGDEVVLVILAVFRFFKTFRTQNIKRKSKPSNFSFLFFES